ncbi:MAG: tetratricopeptide repeat protein [Gemmatimonadales bacterium]
MTPHTNPENNVKEARERFALQDYYGAVHLLEEVLATGRAFADAHHLLGLCRSLLGQQEQALAAFDTAVQLNPRYVEAHIHRGLVLNQLGRTAEAEESFRRASALEGPRTGRFSPHVSARLANQHAALGEAYAEAGALADAVEQYRKAVELGPAFIDLRYRLARLMLDAGNPLGAREELDRVLQARPGFVEAQASLGLAHYLAGDAAEARRVWREALERQPENTRVEAYLAMMDRAKE